MLDYHKAESITMSDLREPDKQDLKMQIEKSGKPLEIVVSSLLDKYKWKSVANTDTFVDREEGKLRDIDICASRDDLLPRIGNLQLETYLTLECKNDPGMAWIFFTRPFKFNVVDIAGQYIDEIQMATRNTENVEIMEMILKKSQLHYENDAFKNVAVTYDRVFLHPPKNYNPQRENQRGKKRKNHLLEAISQLKKYIDWAMDQEVRKRSQVLPYTIEMYFPCIIFQGYMYEATVKENGEMELERRNHILLRTLYRSPYSVYEKGILIDVISDSPFSEKRFSDYNELVCRDMESLKEVLTKNSDEIGHRITGTLELIESTRRTE